MKIYHPVGTPEAILIDTDDYTPEQLVAMGLRNPAARRKAQMLYDNVRARYIVMPASELKTLLEKILPMLLKRITQDNWEELE